MGANGIKLAYLMMLGIRDTLEKEIGTTNWQHALEAAQWMKVNHPKTFHSVIKSYPSDNFKMVDEILQKNCIELPEMKEQPGDNTTRLGL